jgi:hypothetical protein
VLAAFCQTSGFTEGSHHQPCSIEVSEGIEGILNAPGNAPCQSFENENAEKESMRPNVGEWLLVGNGANQNLTVCCACTKIDNIRLVAETRHMHVIIVGWIYVVFMIAVVSDSLVKGFIRFFFLGVIPVGLWMWMSWRKNSRARVAHESEENAERNQ